MSIYSAFTEELLKISKDFLDQYKSLSPEERKEANKMYAMARKGFGSGDGCSPGKSRKGFDFHTHRGHTGWFRKFRDIPIKKIQWVASTA